MTRAFLYFSLSEVLEIPENIYLLQSKCCSVSALFSAQKSIVKISRGVVSETAGIY